MARQIKTILREAKCAEGDLEEVLAAINGALGKQYKPGTSVDEAEEKHILEALGVESSNGNGEGSGEQPEVGEPQSQEPHDEEADPTIGTLVSNYSGKGLNGLELSCVRMAYPELAVKGRISGRLVLDEAWMSLLTRVFDVLLAIQQKVNEDRESLPNWDSPNPSQLLLQGGNTYLYTGVCGHSVEVQKRIVDQRLRSDNAKIAPFLRFCRDCLAVRIALLELLPFAARHDTPCRVCGEALFKHGESGYYLSRGDIWENLVSGVTTVPELLVRLVPQHKDTDSRHRAQKDQFEAWKEQFRLQVAAAISKYPDKAQELRDGMEDQIREKQIEFGLLFV